MKPELWKVYDKHGDNLNLSADPYLRMIFSTDVGKNAAGYAITDPSTAQIIRTHISNTGWGYDNNTAVYLDYTFSETGAAFQVDSSILYCDVSVFIPEFVISKGIGSVLIDDSTNFIYPSVTYAGAIFLDPVSVDLIETEHLSFFQEASIGLITPYDTSYGTLVFKMMGDEDDIKFFTLNNHTQEITWVEELIYDVSSYLVGQGIQINIGFKSDKEGVFERRMVVYHRIGTNNYALAEIVINAQSIGQDERLDTLLENFGLYKPKAFPQLFKEVDINEDLPDWKVLNYKAKHLILEHNQIMPYIGTYKALINAIKWLGYDDIYLKEWFRDVKEKKKISLYIPYDADERKKTIKYFKPEERRNLKKLNQLSLFYCITRETGEIDDWGNPITENCYAYNINEVLIKLFALKEWLERHIIGVNARIIDITGEGVYFERFENYIYGTYNLGSDANYEQSLTPYTLDENSELTYGDASILLSLKEFYTLKIENLTSTFAEMAHYGWDPSNGFFSIEEYNGLSYVDPSAVFFGSTYMYPFKDLYDIQWVLSTEKNDGVVTSKFVTNPLFIHDNEIKFYNIYDVSSMFYDVSADVRVFINKGYLRDVSDDVWTSSLSYSIYPNMYINMDTSTMKTFVVDGSYAIVDGSGVIKTSHDGSTLLFNSHLNPVYFTIDGCAFVYSDVSTKIESPLPNGYILESSIGALWYFNREFCLLPDASPNLMYGFDDNYHVPLLTIKNYKFVDASGTSVTSNKIFFLDILDGRITMDTSVLMDNGDMATLENTIYFNYDTSSSEQNIRLGISYSSSRMIFFNLDPSDASTLYYNSDASAHMIEDNSVYRMDINYTGDYNVYIYGWDGQNTMYYNYLRDKYEVWQKYPEINAYIDTSLAVNLISSTLCVSTHLSAFDACTLVWTNREPIFDVPIPLQGLTLENDGSDYYINVPSMTYFQDLPVNIAKFYNLTERITNISDVNITIDPDYESFYAKDYVKLIKFDKRKNLFISESSSYIISGTSPNFVLDVSPVGFEIDSSTEWYIINDTSRLISQFNISNLTSTTCSCDISSYTFRTNQVVDIIVQDISTGYTSGAAYRVISTSSFDASRGYPHTFSGNFPNCFAADPSKYSLAAKHAFTSFANFEIDIRNSIEADANFRIYLDDTYYHQHYLDNTFVFQDILFDQDIVRENWYDPSIITPFITTAYYPFKYSITLDPSTIVILRSVYDPSLYMLNQKNIWEIKEHDSSDLLMRVYNEAVPFVFPTGFFNINVKSYDSFGNLKEQDFEGLIKIVDNG
jgi:hypothetical protein